MENGSRRRKRIKKQSKSKRIDLNLPLVFGIGPILVLYGELNGDFENCTWKEAIINASDELARKGGLKKRHAKIAIKDNKGKILPVTGKIRDFLDRQRKGNYYTVNVIEKTGPNPPAPQRRTIPTSETATTSTQQSSSSAQQSSSSTQQSSSSTQQSSSSTQQSNSYPFIVPPPPSTLFSRFVAPTNQTTMRRQFSNELENWNDKQLGPCKLELQTLYVNNRPLWNKIWSYMPRTAHLLIQGFLIQDTGTRNDEPQQ